MEAKEKSFGQIMQRANVFKIPFFQRAYVWEKEKHLEKIFDDLYESFNNKNEHFLGSVILKASSGNDNYVSVIDGQQRLTTFSILMKVLYDNLEECRKIFFRDCLFEAYKNDNSPRIIHSKLDKESYIKIFEQSEYILAIETENKIIVCYQFFFQQIKEKNMEANDIFEFIKFLKESKILVEVCLDSKEDEQKIFDSINSTGEPLSSTDIIKNALFDKIIKESSEEEAIKLYGQYWQSIFEEKEEERNFWNTRVGEQRYKSEIFLHAFAVIEGFFNYSKKHNISHLASLYKEQIEKFNSSKLEVFLQKIKEYSTIYRGFPQIIDTKDEKTLFNFDWKLRLFHIVDEYGVNTILPLLLKLEYQLKSDVKNLEKCFKALEILLLCNKQTKSYNVFFAELTQKLPKNNNEIYKYLKEEIIKEYKDEFMDVKKWLNFIKNNKKAKLILFWIELYREFKEREYRDKSSGLHYEYQLEHLMPQKWQKYWSDIADTKEDAEALIYQIGNMTLLKGKLNNEIKNREWLIKLNGDGKARNHISKNAGLCINEELRNKEKWDKKNIEERTQQFIDDFFQIWNIDCFEE